MEQTVRPFMVILIVLLSIVISSGSTYLFVENESSKEESNLQSQINSLESQLSLLKNSSTTVDETADWKTYTNTKYGFSFKYPKEWESTKKEETTETSLGTTGKNLLLKVSFTDPSQQTNEIMSQSPVNNIFVRIFTKGPASDLNTWLTDTFKVENTELADYTVGKAITLGKQNGYLSDISCCAGYDKSYVVSKGLYVYGLGTNHFESDIKEDPSGTFLKIVSTFQFTK